MRRTAAAMDSSPPRSNATGRAVPANGGQPLGDDRDHGFVEQGQALADTAQLHQGTAVEVLSKREQIDVADPRMTRSGDI
jgi:hypothetical protein